MTITAHPTGPPGYSQTMPCMAECVAIARRFVRIALLTWGLGDLAETGALIVSELFTNAIHHTKSLSVKVTVTRPEEKLVCIAVVDKSRALPEPRNPGSDDDRGRGLALIEALCWRWGTERLPCGKRVWCELLCVGGPAGTA